MTPDLVIGMFLAGVGVGGLTHYWLCRAAVRATRPDASRRVGSQAGTARSPGRSQPSSHRREAGGTSSAGEVATVNRSRRGRSDSTRSARLRGVPGDQPAQGKPPGS